MSKENIKDEQNFCREGLQFVKYTKFIYRDKAKVWAKIRRSQKGHILKPYMPLLVLNKKQRRII